MALPCSRLRMALRPLQSQIRLVASPSHSSSSSSSSSSFCTAALRTARQPRAALATLRCQRLYSTDSTDASSSASSSSSTDSTSSTSSSPSSTPASSPPSSPTPSVLDRYRSRLDAKAKKEGVSDIDALRAAYSEKIRALRRKDAVVLPDQKGDVAGSKTTEAAKAGEAEAETTKEDASSTSASASSTTPPPSAAAAAASSSSSSPRSGARPLSSYIDVEKARVLPVEELTAIWRLRFASDPHSLCAVIPAQTYAAMEAAARARPQFVLPVPHPEQGAEIHFLQWTFGGAAAAAENNSPGPSAASTVLFTQVAEYKLRGEFAQPHTTVTHHTDLAAETGVVLMQGQVTEGRGVSADDAQFLVMCLQRFYGAWSIPGTVAPGQAGAAVDEGARARRQLLQWFAAGDPQFSIQRLMDEVEKLV